MGLLARAMVDNGIDVTVLCIDATERPPVIENVLPSGDFHGVRFLYTSGTTIISRYFIVRNLRRLKGILKAMGAIIQFRLRHRPTFLYFWDFSVREFTVGYALFNALAKALGVPVVIEFNERPAAMGDRPTFFEKRFSLLSGVDGAIVISRFLGDWTDRELRRIRKSSFRMLQVPIVVDTNEQQVRNHSDNETRVLFAGAPQYDQTINFILDSMEVVWKRYPTCRLMITGCRPGDPAGFWLNEEVAARRLEGKVDLAGYLSRSDLLEAYAKSSALLIPLFDDVRSIARFPTKIGEYLSSGRPVVTNAVGEIAHFLQDGVSAFVCSPGDEKIYGEKIIEAIGNREQSTAIGLRGRRVAEDFFHYSRHGGSLADFVRAFR